VVRVTAWSIGSRAISTQLSSAQVVGFDYSTRTYTVVPTTEYRREQPSAPEQCVHMQCQDGLGALMEGIFDRGGRRSSEGAKEVNFQKAAAIAEKRKGQKTEKRAEKQIEKETKQRKKAEAAKKESDKTAASAVASSEALVRGKRGSETLTKRGRQIDKVLHAN